MTSADRGRTAFSAPNSPSQPASRWNGFDWLVLPLLLILVCLFFWRILTPNPADRASFPPGDFTYQFWAFAALEAKQLAAGHLPLWNPFAYAGAPFWADIQSAVFYPLSLITVLLSRQSPLPLFNLELEAVAHFWLAGVFSYLLVRRLTQCRPAALVAAIVFTFGGYLTGYPSQQLAVLETNIWLPLLLFLIDFALVERTSTNVRLRARPMLTFSAAAGLIWGIALLAGHPQSAMFVFYTFSLYTLFLALAYRQTNTSQPDRSAPPLQTRIWRSIRAPLQHWLLVVFLGLGLSAIAWLPGLEYMRLSVRAAGFYDKMSGGFPLYDPIQLLLPGSVSHYSPLYVGLLPLVLAVWIALSLRRRETTFWGGLAVGSLLLSFGGETFLYTPFYLLVPGFSIFRDQERLAFVFSLAMAVLAGYGAAYLLNRSRAAADGATNTLRRVVGWLFVGGVALIFLFFYGLISDGWQTDSPYYGLLNRSVWLTILIAMSWGLLHLAGRIQQRTDVPSRHLTNIILPAALLFVVSLDLFTINWKTNIHEAPPESHTQPPTVVQVIKKDAGENRDFRVYNEYRIYENYGVPYEMEDTWGASPLRLERYDAAYRTLRMERLWELLHVKYVITWRQELYAPSEILYSEDTGQDTTYVHRLSTVMPRAWMVYQVEEAAGDAAIARLDQTEFDPIHMAVVPPGSAVAVQQPPDGITPTVSIVARENNSLVVQVDSPASGLLVTSEIYYPGWHATVDGMETRILRTNTILRGVPLSPGRHLVHIWYWPVSFLIGAGLSGLALTAAILLATVGWVQHLRRR
jgi:hypothetical protein